MSYPLGHLGGVKTLSSVPRHVDTLPIEIEKPSLDKNLYECIAGVDRFTAPLG